MTLNMTRVLIRAWVILIAGLFLMPPTALTSLSYLLQAWGAIELSFVFYSLLFSRKDLV